MTPARIAEWITVGTALLIGGLWLGALDNRVQAGEKQLSEVHAQVEATPTQVAVLQTQMTSVQDTVKEVKDQQAKQGDKLDKILERLPPR